jgi:hypothetical protein
MDAEVDINSAWETVRVIIKISAKESLGYFELKKYKPWFKELLDQRKQTKLQRLKAPIEINGENVRCGACRHFLKSRARM